MIEVCHMGCCACVEIDGLDDYEGKPEEALWSFLNYEYVSSGRYNASRVPTLDDLPGHVIFTGIVLDTSYHTRPTYVKDFANYLEREGLGRVTLSPAAFNRINEPDHKIMVGIWQPNQKAVTAWFNKRKKDRLPDEDDDLYDGW